jgi:polar amino acid transport system substrate-binding protein
MENANYKSKLKIALVLDSPGSEELYGVAVRKGDGATLALINKGIAGVKARGIDKDLHKKWIASE